MEYDFERLDVYQEALVLTEKIYILTRNLPSEERYGLISQMRRAAMSVVLNIAEGKGRYYTKVFVQFLYQARGSLYETITLLKMCVQLGYFNQEHIADALKRADVIAGQLNNFIKSMR